MISDYKGFIFDLDGTLVDSMWMWRAIDEEYLGRYGYEVPDELQELIEGMSFSETALYFKERFKICEELEQIKKDWNEMAWDKYSNSVPLKEGVMDLLKYARLHNIKLAIATSNSRQLVEQIIKVHNINGYFNAVVTGCDVNKGKPSPDVYLKAAECIQVVPSDCLVFEDIIPGIQAGKNAGMSVCAVEDAYSLKNRKRKKELSDFYIDTFKEVVNDGKWILTNQ